MENPFRCFNSSPEVIRLAVMMYIRYPLSLRQVEDLLTGSIGIDLELRNRLQGHAMTDVGSIHYDRWSYLPEKRKAMELWANTLSEKLPRGTNSELGK